MTNDGPVKLEPPDFQEQYRASIVPSIREALRRPSALQDITVECGDGEQVATSVVLLAAISPWLRCLLEGAGEGTGLCLPSTTGHQLAAYLESCLTPATEQPEEVAAVHELLAPAWGYQEESATNGVKVEFDLPDVDDMEEDDIDDDIDDFIDDSEVESPIKTEPVIKKLKPRGSPKVAWLRCRFDPKCKLMFHSFKVRTEHERTRHGALYVDTKHRPAYNIVKGMSSECHQCDFSTQDYQEFLEHLRRHQVEDFQCECPDVPQVDGLEGKPITKEFILKERHMRVHHLGWFGCTNINEENNDEECLFMCESKMDMKEHAANSHKDKKFRGEGKKWEGKKPWKNYVCPDCGQFFPPNKWNGQVEYEKHLNMHKVEKFSCDCPDVPKLVMRPGQVRKINVDFRKKERHMKVDHMGWVGCSECVFSAENKDLIEEHMKKHTIGHMCALCGFKADNTQKLRWHTQCVHEFTMVPCPDCGKMVKDKYLKAHKDKVHSAAACEVCGAVVKNVKYHMQSMHTPDSEKRFQCKDCGKGFMSQITLDSHRMNIHLKTQPYQCRYGCDNRYNDISNRSAHERRRHGGTWPGPSDQAAADALLNSRELQAIDRAFSEKE